MSMPPMDQPWFGELWMNVADVFHIKGRGTVVTGQLQGNGQVNLGDTAMADGVTWQVAGLEMFRRTLATAAPGDNIGVLLKNGPAADMLRNQTLMFIPKEAVASNPRLKRRWGR